MTLLDLFKGIFAPIVCTALIINLLILAIRTKTEDN